MGYDEEDHAEHYEDTREFEQAHDHFKAMSVSSTQPEEEHLKSLMAHVATPATPLVAPSGIPTLQLLFGGGGCDCGACLVEDEAGAEFKFFVLMPDTLGHSGSNDVMMTPFCHMAHLNQFPIINVSNNFLMAMMMMMMAMMMMMLISSSEKILPETLKPPKPLWWSLWGLNFLFVFFVIFRDELRKRGVRPRTPLSLVGART